MKITLPRKTRYSLAACAFLLLGAHTPLLNAQENLLRNGQFKQLHESNGLPVVWFVHPQTRTEAQGVTMELARDDSGEAYLHLGKLGGKPFAVSQEIREGAKEEIAGANGQDLVLKAKMRGIDLENGGAVVGVQFFTSDASGKQRFAGRMDSEPVEGSFDWRDVEVKFDPASFLMKDETLERVEVYLSVSSNTGYADFKDLTLELQAP